MRGMGLNEPVSLRAWENEMATLYLTEPRALVKKDGDTLAVHIPEDKERGTEKRQVDGGRQGAEGLV